MLQMIRIVAKKKKETDPENRSTCFSQTLTHYKTSYLKKPCDDKHKSNRTTIRRRPLFAVKKVAACSSSKLLYPR